MPCMQGCSCNDSLGRCAVVFWLAIIFSVIGMAIVLAGLILMNSKFSDFLIYTGAIIMVFSLIWWLFWYMGNIEESDSQYESKQNFSDSNVENLGTNFWHPELRSHPKARILPWCGHIGVHDGNSLGMGMFSGEQNAGFEHEAATPF